VFTLVPTTSSLFSYYSSGPPRALHSFPTRRSSDLGAEGAAHTQYKEPFKQAGFTAAIVADDQIDAGTRGEIQWSKISQPGKGDTINQHGSQIKPALKTHRHDNIQRIAATRLFHRSAAIGIG